MSTHLEDSESLEDSNDDGQLTIRIPNPKVYMARQSQWVGRRGKPRCDQCRANNRKCDRVLPICNHCSWPTPEECKYTPLPTPAHRGIPRCDRCRTTNMKCDRNLPMCNNCTEAGPDTECNYTPKKRNKPKGESDLARLTPESTPKVLPPTPRRKPQKSGQGVRKGLTFYGQNIATSPDNNTSPKISEPETTPDPDSSHTGRFFGYLTRPQSSDSRLPPQKKDQTTPLHQLEFIPHEFESSHEHKKRKIYDPSQEPWAHPSIIPLPGIVLKGLQTVIPYDLHQREEFDNKLRRFQSTIMEDLRETTCLSLDKYTQVAACLAKGDTSKLSERMRSWTSIHRLCSGSDKYSLILAPQDSVFSMDVATADAHRRNFVDALLSASDPEQLQDHYFDVLPVQDQLYDILTYAHRSHQPPSEMLLEIARQRFASVTWPMAEIYVKGCRVCTENRLMPSLDRQDEDSVSVGFESKERSESDVEA